MNANSRSATFAILVLISLIRTAFNLCDSHFRNLNLGPSYRLKSNYFDGVLIKDCGCDINKTCIRKCCDVNYGLVRKNATCVRRNGNGSAEFPVPYSFEKETILLPGAPKCSVYILNEDEFVLIENGKLKEKTVVFDYDQFCVERNENGAFIAVVCFENVEDDTIGNKITNIGMLVSLPFLLATLVIYALLPQRNLHGNALICYVFSLFMGFLLLVSLRINIDKLYGKEECLILSLPSLFFFFTSFCWMNVMCIDIWWTFSGLNTRMKGIKRIEDQKRFILYSAYAWGVPLLWIIIIISLTFSNLKANAWYFPNLRATCWFISEVQTLVFFYGPLAILTISNIVLFLITAFKIRKAHQDTAMLRRDESKKHGDDSDQKRFFVYLKLLLIMGGNWSMEIISWVVDWQVGKVPPAVWYLTDLCNALYGILIFFLFCFNKKIWNMLKTRYNTCKSKRAGNTLSTESSTLSSNRYKVNDNELLASKNEE